MQVRFRLCAFAAAGIAAALVLTLPPLDVGGLGLGGSAIAGNGHGNVGNGNGNGGANGHGNGGGNGNAGGKGDGGGNGNGRAGSAGGAAAGTTDDASDTGAGISGDDGGFGAATGGATGKDKAADTAAAIGTEPVTVTIDAQGSFAIVDNRPKQAADKIVAAGLSTRDLRKLIARGFRIGERSKGSLGVRVYQLSVPDGLSIEAARSLVASLNRSATVDLDNYYYLDGGPAECDRPSCEAREVVGWSAPALAACGTAPTIGVVDTSIDVDQPALKGQRIDLVTEAAAGLARSSPEHGTSVAALFVGRGDSVTPGLMPAARLIAVDAFYKSEVGERTDVTRLVAAIETLTERGAKVINLSLSGPPNELLQKAIDAALARDVVIVSAAGNGGPGAAPAYPAAYPGVVAVTAVDRKLEVYARANHGDYVDLAAPGVDLWTASLPDGGGPKSGTSYAVPFVSAAAAVLRALRPELTAAAAKSALYASARDLGDKGRDPVFGWGLVQAGSLCAPSPGPSGIGAAAPADAVSIADK